MLEEIEDYRIARQALAGHLHLAGVIGHAGVAFGVVGTEHEHLDRVLLLGRRTRPVDRIVQLGLRLHALEMRRQEKQALGRRYLGTRGGTRGSRRSRGARSIGGVSVIEGE